MKKLMSLLFVVLFALIISACAPKKQTWGEPQYKWTVDPGMWDATIGEYRPEYHASLKLWVDNADYAEAIIKEYKKLFPEVNVKYEIVGAVDTRAKAELDGPAGLGADVFVMPHDHIGQALITNVIGTVGDYEQALKDRIVTASIQTVTAVREGKEQVFAFPISGESLALFYNRDVLTAKGVDLATTWEQILAQAQQFNDPTKNFFWVLADVGNAYDMHFVATAHGYQLFGANHNDPAKVNFSSPEFKSALTWVRNYRMTALNVESAALTGENNKNAFETGKAAYIVDGPWSIDRYTKAGINFGVVKLPTIKVNGTDVQPVTFSGNQLAAVGTYSKFPAAARTLANFMSSAKGAEILYGTLKKLPVLKDTSMITGLADDLYLKGISDQLAYSQPMPTIPEMTFFWTYAGQAYSNAWNAPEGLTPAQSADKAETDFYNQVKLGK